MPCVLGGTVPLCREHTHCRAAGQQRRGYFAVVTGSVPHSVLASHARSFVSDVIGQPEPAAVLSVTVPSHRGRWHTQPRCTMLQNLAGTPFVRCATRN